MTLPGSRSQPTVRSGAVDWLRSMPEFPDVSTVVVVDGGGTRSRAAVASGDGALLGYAEGGPTNARAVGDEAASANVAKVVADALDAGPGKGRPEVSAVLVTSASVDTEDHAAVLADGVRRSVPTNATLSVVADTLGCWAATAKLAPAVAVIAGTGSAVLAASMDEGSRRYGGWDYLLGDEGSGFAMGRAALRETLLVAEGSSSAQALADACCARLDVAETDELFDRVYKPEVDKAYVASFAGDVLRLASEGDEGAAAIVQTEATALVATVVAAFRDFAALRTLGCFGGIWHADVYQDAFSTALADRLHEPPAIVVPGDVAMAGAFRIVLRHHGDQVLDPAEDGAVDRFTAELAAAKEAATEAAEPTGRRS